MIDSELHEDAREARKRLTRAEQAGLRLALACRSALTGAAFFWYVAAAFIVPEVSTRFVTLAVLLGFTAVGVAHLAIIGTRYDRHWIKYAIYALDSLALCAAFALVPISRAEEIPQIMAFRSYGIYYLFPVLAMACLSLSWRLVLWTGGMIIVGWWAAFAWVVSGMDQYLSWSDMPSHATQADYEAIFLSIDFIGRGNRIEETGMVFFATIALTVAVYRARTVFFAQVAADVERQRERAMRERVSNLLGKHIPVAVAERLIADDTPLRPQRCHGTALVMDIAGFTAFSARHEPEEVVEALDRFLADATKVVSTEGGIVITYLGDGFLATFNAPVQISDPQTAALRAARGLRTVTKKHGFGIRIGIATGSLVTGIIGNETRQSFTVYGDAVNLASRLEGACKDVGLPVIMDEATGRSLDASTDLHALGNVSIRGFEGQVQVFAPTFLD